MRDVGIESANYRCKQSEAAVSPPLPPQAKGKGTYVL